MTGGMPHWQLDSIYPGLASAEFTADKQRLGEELVELARFMDEHGVRERPEAPSGRDAASTTVMPSRELEALEGALMRLSAALLSFGTLSTFLSLTVSVNAFDEAATAEASLLKQHQTRLSTLYARFTAWSRDLDLAALAEASSLVARHRHFLGRRQVEADRLMGEQAEELAAKLDESGGSAWSKLYHDLVSRETVNWAVLSADGEPGEYTITELKVLQSHEDALIRQRAFEAELALLARNQLAFAAAMNGIKGQVAALGERRGWASALDQSLFQAGITRASLAAMHGACEESFPALRDYLRAKAWHLGKPQLAWYDLMAPLPAARAPRFTWDQAKGFVIERFARYSPELASFAERAFARRWIDVPPRKGKRNGAFCSALHARRETRVMLNFGGSLGDVFTLAHELGHAYHADCMFRFGRDRLQVESPMTLNETASIFCETIVLDGMLEETSGAARLAVLEQHLQQATQLVIDIHSRYLFEATVFDNRLKRELNGQELNDIMLDAQARTYGDALDPQQRHPLMWAQKPHYYSSGRSYYNFPYTFGFLFGLGLFAVYLADPEPFRRRYDELLASTGMADAAGLARDFGIDIEDREFWRGSLRVVTGRAQAFKELTEVVTA